MKNPQVSVIIPLCNGSRYIVKTIESVLSQTYQNIEIIVIDDGSKDDSLEKINPYLSRIKYIYQQNRGTAAARNTGIENSSGEFIALLDADDVWTSEKIEFQVKYMLEHPKVCMVHTNSGFIDKNGNSINGVNWSIGIQGICFKELFI